MPDRITISSLAVHLAGGLGPSAFNLDPPPPCPVNITIDCTLIPSCVPSCAANDTMSNLGVNYSALSKAVYARVSDPKRVFASPTELLREIADEILLALDAVDSVDIVLELPRAALHAQSVRYGSTFARSSPWTAAASSTAGIHSTNQWCEVHTLQVACVVGLHPHERKERQRLEVDARVTAEYEGEAWSHKALADAVFEYVERSTFGTIEALAHELSAHLLMASNALNQAAEPRLDLTVHKPSAIPFATPSVSVSRTRADYPASSRIPVQTGTQGESSRAAAGRTRAFIALGSNIGDSVGHIRRAVEALQAGGCDLVDCSRLYESEPMYVEDQARFVNGAVQIETALSPIDLLRLLKRTEREVGRTKTFRNGPRVVDLDLLFYGDERVMIGNVGDEEDEDGVGWLEVPHPRIREREFVLRPLNDMAPTYSHPSFGAPISLLLGALPPPAQLAPIVPFPAPARPLRLSLAGQPSTPAIMSIFNATPDSFSDGDPARTDAAHALDAIRTLLQSCGDHPPAILDIGGMSTRPNSVPCSVEEEIARVVPLIQAIRAALEPVLASIPISIDTYRPEVARAAVAAGASCINDVRGGREPGMLETMAESGVPVVLMHSRGDSVSMTSAEAQDYSALGGVVPGVAAELGDTVQRGLRAGIKRWNILLDPGLGFAKSQDGNLSLLKHLDQLVAPASPLHGYPLLVGASRKGFVGKITGVQVAAERGYGDAAVNAWCVTSGVVDVLRVHDPKAASETVRMLTAVRDAQ